jgi:hypothetical protein
LQCACGDGIAGDVILIRLVEKMATCILIFVAVILLRVLIRAIAMRCYPSLGTSFLQCPEFEGPCLLSQFWALTDSLAKGVGDGCTVFTQLLSAVLLLCGPCLALGWLARHLMNLRMEGVMTFEKKALTWAEMWESMRGAAGLKEKYSVLKAWLVLGTWDVEADARVQRMDFLISDYNDNLVHFYALRMFKQIWMSVTLASTSGRPNIIFVFLAQLMELFLQVVYAPFNDKAKNVTESISQLCNTVAILCVGITVLTDVASPIDDTVLVIVSSLGTMVTAVGSFSLGSFISAFSTCRGMQEPFLMHADTRECCHPVIISLVPFRSHKDTSRR